MSVDRSWLEQIVAEDEHGLLDTPVKAAPKTSQSRLVDAFQEICAFIETHGRSPEENPNDIAEWQLAHRLKGIVNDPEQCAALAEYDIHGVLVEPEPPASIEEIIAKDDLGILDGDGDVDIFTLRHVPGKTIQPDEVAERRECKDFDEFRDLFTGCQAELKTGERALIDSRREAVIQQGTFFVIGGVLAYVAEVRDEKKQAGRRIARLRVIYENGTESNLLLRSLARRLYDDGRVVTESNHTTLEKMGLEPNTPMGAVYVLRSMSTDPQVVAIPNLCKIGFTKGKTADRIKNAANEKTYLNAPVRIVREFMIPSAIASNIETLIQTFFASARIDVTYERDGEKIAVAREWFSVPIEAIDEAIQLISAGTVISYAYDPERRCIGLRA